MNLNEFKDRLFQRAQEEGFTEYEIYYVEGNSFRVGVYEKEIDQYSVNNTIGLSFRGLYEGKMGYAYTEVLDEDAIELLIQNGKANALAIEKDDMDIIYGGGDSYQSLNSYNEELNKVRAEEKIELALKMEEEALKQSEYVKRTQHCVVSSGQGLRRIINSKGLDLTDRRNSMYAVLIPVVEKDGKMNTGVAFRASNQFSDFDPRSLAQEAVEKALAYIGADSVPSGKYRVALRYDAATDLLATFSDIFSADNAQKGLSLLKGKVGQVIASEKVTIIDDPLMEGGLCSASFDDEGVATYTKAVIEKGKLMTLLHNLKTAKKDGVKTTGNGSKASYASPVDISPFNFYIKPGEKSYEEMLACLDKGLLITELQGMHSGANTVSGDFSLAAKGFWVENGKAVRPVEQITIAGNFYKLLEDVEEVGADLKFDMPAGACFGSPTIIVRELSVAGK